MESPGLIWIPTGVGVGQPALPGRPRDGPPVVLRDRRQRPGARAVRRRGRRRLRRPLRPGAASGRAAARPAGSTCSIYQYSSRVLLRDGSTSRAATCSTRPASGWARPRSGRRCAATSRHTATGSRRRVAARRARRGDAARPRPHAVRAALPAARTSGRAPSARSAASACGIWRNDRGQERAPGAPAGDEPGRDEPLARTPGEAVVVADGRRAAGRPTATASRRRRRPGSRAEPRRAAAPSGGCRTTPASSRATGRDADGSGRAEHRGHVALERLEVGREHRVGHAERPADRPRLGVERGPARRRERLEPGVGDRDRRVDERGVDPQRRARGRAPRSPAR